MKIKSIIIENFRGYKDRQIIDLNDFTAFVGRNDAGKSTILEALDIFFNDNKGIIEIDAADINKQAREENGKTDIVIGVEFIDLPSEVCIDENNKTTLKEEYLLNEEGNLTIIRSILMAVKQLRCTSLQIIQVEKNVVICYLKNSLNYKNLLPI